MAETTAYKVGWNVSETIRRWRNEAGRSLRQLEEKTYEIDLLSRPPEARGEALVAARNTPKGRAKRTLGVSAAQLHRIEQGEAEPTMREYHLIALALNQDPVEPLKAWKDPAFRVFRRAAYEAAITEMKVDPLRLKRRDGAHQIMFDANKYRYMPLESPEDVSELGATQPEQDALRQRLTTLLVRDEYRGGLKQAMRLYLFEIEHSGDELMLVGADKHAGEEVVMILSGRAELWLAKPNPGGEIARGERTRDGFRDPLVLESGDIAHYSAEIPHAYRAIPESSSDKSPVVRALFAFAAPGAVPLTQEIFDATDFDRGTT